MTIQNEKCRQLIKKGSGFCERVNSNVPKCFCELVCRGKKPEKWNRERIKKARTETFLKNPTPKGDNELTTVIISAVKEDEKYLERTIKSVKNNAIDPIEVIVIADGWKGSNGELSYPTRIGMRKATNIAAEKAKGRYLFNMDGHCAISSGWDVRLKSACKKETIVISAVDRLNENTWQGEGGDMSFVTLDASLRMQYIYPYELIDECPLESDVITMGGCSWMLEKDYYFKLGGCDEKLGMWGELGAEWSLKAWLTGGKMIMRTDVICSHLFRETTPFIVDPVIRRNALGKLCRQWIFGQDNRRTKTPGWLVEKFAYINKKDVCIFGLGGAGYSIMIKDWEFLKSFIQKNHLKNILEFGSGKSTLMLDNLRCKVISYDTLPYFAITVQALSSERTHVLQWNDYTSAYGINKIRKQFDLLFIDGPAGGENREQSYKVGSKVNTRYIACHDAHREWESKWIDKYLSNRKCILSMDDDRIKVFE